MNICIACAGHGTLARFFTQERHDCPWCAGSGRVVPEVNAAFRRVFHTLPGPARATAAFGTANKPVLDGAQETALSLSRQP
jgi:hypothetical protein